MNPKGIQGSVHYSVPGSRVQGSVEDWDIHVNSERKLQLARHLLEVNMIQQMNWELSFEQTRKTELQNVFEELFNNFEARYGLTN